MSDCPDNISLEECLKRKLKKAHLQKDSNKHNRTPPLLKIKSQQAMASTLFKETTLDKKSSNSSGITSHASSHHVHIKPPTKYLNYAIISAWKKEMQEH
jgi:hypothetical protein